MNSWWGTQAWHDYEKAYDGEPGKRAALLNAVPWETRIIDLSQTEAVLWAGVRRSYHSLINKMGRDYPLNSLVPGAHGSIIGREILDEQLICKALHEQHAGRQTRDDETWVMQSDWVQDGHGMLTLVTITSMITDERLLQGYSYWVIHDGWAYYFSGVAGEKDLGLAMVWWSMLALKELGVRWCETGWQGEAPEEDKKRQGIEFARRGFGGRDVPARCSGRALTDEEWFDAAE